ncbi:MAG: ribose 5-phosphate isomerase B [Epsilonproteobacteria bacterium]|nr:ribose 5-phosphate isomerase B [Campylobacterota bacterium]
MNEKRVVIGSDHAGFEMKEQIKKYLRQKGYDVLDEGTDSTNSVDYPDFAAKTAAECLKNGAMGIVICGTGIGASISANKIKGIRAALCHDAYTAIYSRRHNDANILTLGGRVTGIDVGIQIVDLFLSTKFDGGRHRLRIDKISKLEEE